MAIKTFGSISLGNIQAEFGGTAPHSLSEYFRGGGGFVSTNNTKIPEIGNALVPATNKFSNYYGGELLVSIGYEIVAGGGGSGGWGNTAGTSLGGGGGGAGGILQSRELWLPLGTYNVTVGLGGVGGAAKESGSNGGDSKISHATRIMSTVAVGGGGGGGINLPGKDGGSGGGGGLSTSTKLKTAGGGCVPGQGHLGGFGFSNSYATFDGNAGTIANPATYRGSGGGGGFRDRGLPYEGNWGNWYGDGNRGGHGYVGIIGCFGAGGGGSSNDDISINGYAPGAGLSQCQGSRSPGNGGRCNFKSASVYVDNMNGVDGHVIIQASIFTNFDDRKFNMTVVNGTLLSNSYGFGPYWHFTRNGTFTISLK
jgi:hypothetical protein